MSFDKQIWLEKFQARLQNWRQRMLGSGVGSIYAFVAASALWPVVEAFRQGDLAAIAALGGVLAGVGTNLLANRIQAWRDEAEAAQQIEQEVMTDASLRRELDTVLETFKALPLAQQALAEPDRAWFAQILQEELKRLGNWGKFEAELSGSGAIAQGPGAVAAGERGVAIGGNVQGSVLITGNSNIVAPHSLPTKRNKKEKDQ